MFPVRATVPIRLSVGSSLRSAAGADEQAHDAHHFNHGYRRLLGGWRRRTTNSCPFPVIGFLVNDQWATKGGGRSSTVRFSYATGGGAVSNMVRTPPMVAAAALLLDSEGKRGAKVQRSTGDGISRLLAAAGQVADDKYAVLWNVKVA
jgi:hypothetical protein